jgi:iron-sulfur cluster repair protein YtfE (RIC family)
VKKEVAMGSKIDMTMMYAMHDALRRELERIARVTARIDDDPRRLLGAAVGWAMFKSYLHAHHIAEDETVWAVMERLLADRPDDLALLAAMESEHASIDALLGAVDAAVADRDSGPQRLGDVVDALAAGLGGHLRHEETEALPLIDVTLTEQQWQRLGQRQAELIGADAPRYLPWLLDDMDPARVTAVLSRIPAPFRVAYRDEWQARYAGLRLWPAASA